MHPGPPSFSSTSSSIFFLSLFFLKHSDCHLTPPRVIFLERRKPPFSLFLIWPQPKPTVAFPMWALCTAQDCSQPVHGALSLYRECLHHTLSGWAGIQSSFKGQSDSTEGKHFSYNKKCVNI